MRPAREHSRGSRWIPDLAALVTVLVLTGPMWWRSGHGLARDLVFTPRHPLGADAIGMGAGLPRAVPLDAVLALLTTVLDGAVLFRLAVGGVLLLAACGAHRALSDLPVVARVLAAVFALWNPYVVERLALGQWALLAAYAALWWLLPALRAALDGEPGGLRRVLVWAWLGSLTPSGGVLVVMLVASTCLVRRGEVARVVRTLAVVCVGQLPWLLPSLLAGSGAVSDPLGVSAFASRAERPGGAVATLVGTGGVWSPFVTPSSLGTGFGLVLTAVVVVVLVLNVSALWRSERGLLVAAAVGFLLAALPHLPGGADLLRWSVEQVPGAGILRDSQKWLMPYALVVVVSAARSLAAARHWLRERDEDLGGLVAVILVLAPLMLMPDAMVRTWEAVRPVHLPADLTRAVAVLDAADADTGAVVAVPWSSYREFSWGNPVSAADPLPRWTRHSVVSADALATPRGKVSGEDPRAREVAALLRGGDPGKEGRELADRGIGWVLVYRDQPGAASLGLSGMEPVLSGAEVSLYQLPGPVARRGSAHSRASLWTVAAVDLAWLVAGAAALLSGARTWAGRRRRVRVGAVR